MRLNWKASCHITGKTPGSTPMTPEPTFLPNSWLLPAPERVAGPLLSMSSRTVSPYHQELSEFRVAYSKAGSITSIVLVLLGAGLDFSVYPERLGQFMAVRVGIALLTLVIFLALYTAAGRAWVRP